MTNNKSKIYTNALSAKTRLVAQLALLDEYLEAGQGTTKIDFIGSRGKVLTSRTLSSNWTTANGKLRLSTIHGEFINDLTKVDSLPFGTVKVKVTSPFVESKTTHVQTKVDVILPFTYTATA